MITEFDSIFHENGFIFVNERSSYNRNGNRKDIGATSAKEYRLKKAGYSDPRDKMRGANSNIREKRVNDKKGEMSSMTNILAYNNIRNKATKKNDNIKKRNIEGSQKYVNADRSNKSWDKASDDYKSREKIIKHQAAKESALMESIELI